MRLDLGIADRLVPWHDKIGFHYAITIKPGRGFMHVLEIKTAANTVFVVLAKIKRSIGGKPELF